MRVGIVDVGANTLRLLVAAPGEAGCVKSVRAERAQLGLGEEIEQNGTIGSEKLDEAAAVAKDYVKRARRARCERIEILVTSPGRQAANGNELLAALEEAAGVPVRVLGRDEEGALAWRGAVACAEGLPESVAVCDVGGGSTQLAVGTLTSGACVDALGRPRLASARAPGVRVGSAQEERPRPRPRRGRSRARGAHPATPARRACDGGHRTRPAPRRRHLTRRGGARSRAAQARQAHDRRDLRRLRGRSRPGAHRFSPGR